MGKTLFQLFGGTSDPCADYQSHEVLYNGLKTESASAICCLANRIKDNVQFIGKQHQLSPQDIEELMIDGIAICIEKIRAGKYTYQGFDPATYVIEIVKNRAHNLQRRAQKHQSQSLDTVPEPSEEGNFASKEAGFFLEALLVQLDANCQHLIRLKYLEEYRDKDVIQHKLTQYTTVDALKNHRSKCMKKLLELSKALDNVHFG